LTGFPRVIASRQLTASSCYDSSKSCYAPRAIIKKTKAPPFGPRLLHRIQLGPPLWTGLSTNAGCQPLKQRFETEFPGGQDADPKLRSGIRGAGSMTKQIRNFAASPREVLGVHGLDVDRLRVAGNLMRRSQELERVMVARAVRWHLEHRILQDGDVRVSGGRQACGYSDLWVLARGFRVSSKRREHWR